MTLEEFTKITDMTVFGFSIVCLVISSYVFITKVVMDILHIIQNKRKRRKKNKKH